MTKKKTQTNEEMKDEHIVESEVAVDAMVAMQANNAQLQQTAQNAIAQLQQYMQLCSHYEQTINVLSGRVQELNRTIAALQQQQQQQQQQ